MSDVTLAITILWMFIFVYSILGSIDFGSGYWALVFGKGMNTKAGDIANRFLSPTWKVTNVFLVLLVVALVGFFPKATFTLGTLLVLPVCLALVLLTIRSTFMVYAYSVHRFSRMLSIVSGITGLLIPALLVSVLPITLGGFVTMEAGTPVLAFGKLLQSPTEYAHLGFGLATELFLSALFLADYAREAQDEMTYRIYRQMVIILGPLTLVMAVLTTVAMTPEAQWIVANFKQQWLWFTLSAVSFIIGYIAMWIPGKHDKVGYPRIAMVAVILQYALASYAYGASHLPYMLYPYLTVEQGFTNHAMFRSLLIGYIVSSAVLIPVFIWFWKLFLKDKRYLNPESE
ncbi:cytochrome d ubiquinol oxidase subunit II [Paenibacillus sp. N3.4]|uniref:cytochrome d ubiquinol oxidase subunit II n=1 Tax=Paenibacillus sp. N3.4 TaxID=2603222 RepID=UPI0011C9EBAF|nr:cytochrome d ubiquinol oxidase subunit II [Paenibacillus sp. N3.4]TXK75175.1 hypothetical protein FU659_27800 [Paenibacillus sp. N3.4]